MVVCLVARQREVGVDVEDRERRGRLLDVADRYFSPTEVRALRALPAEERLERFFVYWTLKESYIKARGMGLAIPLSQFSFHVDEPTRGIYISFDPRLDDDPLRWQFTMMSHGRAHRIAACVSRTGHEHVRFVVREGVPSAE
jgi:4'-phosphopantetheinyl transferase